MNHDTVAKLQGLGINLERHTAGQHKVLCPFCTPDRKNKRDKSLSVNIDTGVYTCHHCGKSGGVSAARKREYVRPLPRLEVLPPTTLEWFSRARGISNHTLLVFKVTQSVEWMPKAEGRIPVVCFNYYRGEELVNIKFRGKGKDFLMAKDAELIFYNLNACADREEIIITEGEIDALSFYEAGLVNVVSVPNGASKGNARLEYLDNCLDAFAGKKKIYLCTDGDEAGVTLRDELARRLGKERCYRVEYPEGCKDANEVLLRHGKDAVQALIANATQWPLEGIFTVDDLESDIEYYYIHGFPSGIKVGIPDFDDHLSLMGGQFTTVTGSPSSGKSEWCDLIIARTIQNHGWPWAIVSFENQPTPLHYIKIMEKVVGLSFGHRSNPLHRMSTEQMRSAKELLKPYLFSINVEQADLSLDGLLEKCAELVRRNGVKGVLIDPWNYIEHKLPGNQTETQYINDCLTKIKVFNRRFDTHTLLVAHPVKLRKENGKYEVATLYHISGSAHFYNKTDNGLSVYRNRDSGIVDIHVQKVRYSWHGREGLVSFTFDPDTRQYKTLSGGSMPATAAPQMPFPESGWEDFMQ